MAEIKVEVIRYVETVEILVSTQSIVIRPHHEIIKDAVCQYYKVSFEDLMHKSRKSEFVHRRKMLCHLLKNLLSMTDKEVGEALGIARQKAAYYTAQYSFQSGIYLQVSCEQKDIEKIYKTLLEKQQECLTTLQSKNTTR